jgi:valyl-tRNA synthetase
MTNIEIPTRYDALSAEAKWYTAWESAGLFGPIEREGARPYTITIPPPNITGSLHMGHALCYPLQDAIGRYRRLRGDEVLVLPGQDHAGIATQSVVDKQLRAQGISASQLGREKFEEKVWEWRKESGDLILRQFRALGCAFDWSRTRFTLDDDYAQAVLQVFVDWFDRGLIFRGKRVVNWDPKLKTSVSDIETERQMVQGTLYHLRYPLADGTGEVVVATTRPETMLGDVAVAVHPSDERYKHLVGQHVRLPLTERTIPIIADPYPDPAFGTGAVKITPAHDPNDYLVGVRQNLPMPVVLDESARICEPGSYLGLDRKEARRAIVHDLEQQGYLVRTQDHEIAIVISDRSKEVIEPLLSEEWFCDQPALAQPIIEAVERGEVRFQPARYERIFLEWMRNIREWNISRRLWWGHRIPVYYTAEGRAIAGLSWDEAQRKAGDEKIVRQDEDVLDTWFSSGLWPFATLGWPKNTPDFERFFPTQTLVTDRNIINLWVSRMLMMSQDLTGRLPFSTVVIHATVMREDGRRMSKSLGTGVDPMSVIETLGADVLRWTLLSQSGENQEIRYSERKNEESRNWINKIWNATRFVLMNADSEPAPPAELELVDRWLLSRLATLEATVREAYDNFDLMVACQSLQKYFWSEVCDWYIEVAKPRLQDTERRETPQWVLLQCFDAFLRMLHPITPFVSEELYAFLPLANRSPFLMAATWPQGLHKYADPDAERRVARAFAVTRALRNLRSTLGVAPSAFAPQAFFEGDLEGLEEIVRSQARIEQLHTGRTEEPALSAVEEGVTVQLPVQGLLDVEREREKAERERAKLQADALKLENRLNNPEFIAKAKPEVIAKERATLAELAAKQAALEERLRLLN